MTSETEENVKDIVTEISKEEPKKPSEFAVFLSVNTVLKIGNHSFIVKSYDIETEEIVLKYITREEAKFVLMDGKLKV